MDESQLEAISRFLVAARNKGQKDYGSGILLFVFDLYPAFWLNDGRHRNFLQQMITEVGRIKFRVESVYLILIPTDYVDRLGMSRVVQVQ